MFICDSSKIFHMNFSDNYLSAGMQQWLFFLRKEHFLTKKLSLLGWQSKQNTFVANCSLCENQAIPHLFKKKKKSVVGEGEEIEPLSWFSM